MIMETQVNEDCNANFGIRPCSLRVSIVKGIIIVVHGVEFSSRSYFTHTHTQIKNPA